jgi:DNA-binding protein Fis
MPKKKSKSESPLEEYINSLIDKKLEDWNSEIKKEDATEIVNFLMPEIEKKISEIVLKHLKAIATYTINQLKED